MKRMKEEIYHAKEKELTEEEGDKKREYDRLQKEKSCKNQVDKKFKVSN